VTALEKADDRVRQFADRCEAALSPASARRGGHPRRTATTRTPKVAIRETVTDAMGWIGGTATYALGWIINATPNGRIIRHNGGTSGFGALNWVPAR
jgi:hypothetical protein